MNALRRILGIHVLLLILAATSARAIALHATDVVNQGLYTIDTNTFAVNLVGNYAIPGNEFFIGGLAYDRNGVLYGSSAGLSAELYIISPANAFTQLVGPLNTGFVFEGGLAFDPNTFVLYAVNQGNAGAPVLMTLNTTIGQATLVGQIGSGEHDFGGIAFDQLGQLYGLDRVTNALWRIDKTNPSGALTVQVGAGLGNGIVMGPAGGMTDDTSTGIYYGYSSESHHLFTVNLLTGVGTVLHQFTPNDPVFYSLAYRLEVYTATQTKSWGSLKALYRQ